jgi:hypothetical protein
MVSIAAAEPQEYKLLDKEILLHFFVIVFKKLHLSWNFYWIRQVFVRFL